MFLLLFPLTVFCWKKSRKTEIAVQSCGRENNDAKHGICVFRDDAQSD